MLLRYMHARMVISAAHFEFANDTEGFTYSPAGEVDDGLLGLLYHSWGYNPT